MPQLNWSPGALAAVKDNGKRKEMNRLFDAYFRAAGHDALTGTILHLDLPTETRGRYHFHARFTKTAGWLVETELKHEYRTLV
jgi:hypothetical protein